MSQATNSSVPASIFRAYDIRGIVDDTLTEATVEQIGRAIGSEAAAPAAEGPASPGSPIARAHV